MNTSFAENSRRMSAEHTVDRFENHFNVYIGEVADIIILGGAASAAKNVIQLLVNSYHDLGRIISPLTLPTPSHFSTLKMFVLITGANLQHSGDDESLKILQQADRMHGE